MALALVGLWGAYLVPHKLRHRQQLLESRTDDRYSQALRVVRVSDRGRSGRTARGDAGAPAVGATSSTAGLLTPGTGVPVRRTGTATGGTAVDRPTATQDRISADAARRLAQARAARAAAAARRGAAARRRGFLAAALVVATLAGWAVAVLSPLTWVVGTVPTVLLTTVVVLGRRAVLAGKAADAAWAETEERLLAQPRTGATRVVTASGAVPAVEAPAEPHAVPTPLVTGRAVHPSDARTETFARIVVDDEAGRAAAAPKAPVEEDPDAWSPVPVPRPTYTMKADAPRREPAPLGEVEGSTAVAPQATTPAAPVEPPVQTTGSIDLDAVLAKRRASGE